MQVQLRQASPYMRGLLSPVTSPATSLDISADMPLAPKPVSSSFYFRIEFLCLVDLGVFNFIL